MSYVQGGPRLRAKLNKIKSKMRKNLADANRKNGEDVIRIAEVLIPEESSESKFQIHGTVLPDGYLMDFGEKSKVIEGDSGPRPFVNPALSVTRKRRQARLRRAARSAIKDAMNGG